MDFITFHNVGIQVNKHVGNFMSFLEWPGVQVPLVEPNSPNLPETREDPRFQGASIFRQRLAKGATAAACQEEVGTASKGKPAGRPPDQILGESCHSSASQVDGKEGYLLHPNADHCGTRGVEPSNPSNPSNSSHPSHPSTQVDASSHQGDASSHQDDVDDEQQAERGPGNSTMGGGDQRVGGEDDTAGLPLMGGGANALVEAALGNALVGLDNNEEVQLPPSDSEADEGVG